MLRIVKLDDSSNSNVPIMNTTDYDGAHLSMVTEIFTVYNADVDYVASKIRHLITKKWENGYKQRFKYPSNNRFQR